MVSYQGQCISSSVPAIQRVSDCTTLVGRTLTEIHHLDGLVFIELNLDINDNEDIKPWETLAKRVTDLVCGWEKARVYAFVTTISGDEGDAVVVGCSYDEHEQGYHWSTPMKDVCFSFLSKSNSYDSAWQFGEDILGPFQALLEGATLFFLMGGSAIALVPDTTTNLFGSAQV
jgi:hypothetical protein